MLFNSIPFIFFLFFAVLIYFISKNELKGICLLLISVIFYYFNNAELVFFPLILYILTAVAIKSFSVFGKKKIILISYVVALLLILFFYKYFTFTLDITGVDNDFFDPLYSIIIPLGLSYLIFQLLALLIDLYSSKDFPPISQLSLLNYIYFFPKIIAGPIEKYQNFQADYSRSTNSKPDKELIYAGISRFVWGLFKKVVIADRIALLLKDSSEGIGEFGLVALICIFLFTIQLYFDFSGYIDMAIGIGMIFGFKMPENFNHPFSADSITDFWRRWHITLSSWFREYVFTPLSISYRRYGQLSIIFSLFLVFILIGLWHGAAWGFVIFGFIQAVVIVIETLLNKPKKKIKKKLKPNTYNILGVIYTFIIISYSLVFFKNNSIEPSISQIKSSIVNWQFSIEYFKSAFSAIEVPSNFELLIILLSFGYFIIDNNEKIRTRIINKFNGLNEFYRIIFYFLLINALIYLGYWGSESFIYDQF